MNIQQNMSLMEKLSILTAAAKYDVACTSSGVDRRGNGTGMGNSLACGICHSFSADGRCISLLKILFTNECIFNCAYCQNNCNSDVKRASFTPDEVCELTIEFYRRNYIEGLDQSQLHDGSDLSDPLPATQCLPFQRLYPCQSDSRRRSCPCGKSRFSCRPYECQFRTSDRRQLKETGSL